MVLTQGISGISLQAVFPFNQSIHMREVGRASDPSRYGSSQAKEMTW